MNILEPEIATTQSIKTLKKNSDSLFFNFDYKSITSYHLVRCSNDGPVNLFYRDNCFGDDDILPIIEVSHLRKPRLIFLLSDKLVKKIFKPHVGEAIIIAIEKFFKDFLDTGIPSKTMTRTYIVNRLISLINLENKFVYRYSDINLSLAQFHKIMAQSYPGTLPRYIYNGNQDSFIYVNGGRLATFIMKCLFKVTGRIPSSMFKKHVVAKCNIDPIDKIISTKIFTKETRTLENFAKSLLLNLAKECK